VALFQGRSEMGPRALGHRSILMSPFTAAAREHLNHVVKRREPFRPFAPVVRLEDAEEYFDLGVASPFMLYVCPVRERWRERLAGVTHVDGSARPQTLAAGQNPRLRRLLTQFGQRTGVPVLLNTSFNVAGEPLVESPADAVRCFRAAALDALLLGDILLEKRRS
jgi:carbamoyltransferase